MNRNLARLLKVATKKDRIIVGLMSGTSLDGLDVALCKISGHGLKTKIALMEFKTVEYTPEVKRRISEVFAKPQVDFEKLCRLSPWIGRLHGKMVLDCIKGWGRRSGRIDLIASHGQTVFHAPSSLQAELNMNSTLQIGDGDHVAVTTGIMTISDFRQKHVAMGGEGAPLAVYGDFLLFSHKKENRVLLNIGGIGNFTFLGAGQNSNKAFVTDTGPGNTLLDQKVRSAIPNQYFDRDGKLASQGNVHSKLLEELKSDPFFRKSFPKTTGPELFNLGYLIRAQEKSNSLDLSLTDILATLTRFSAETIAEAILKATKKKKFELYGSGGGMHNSLLIKWIQDILKIQRIRKTDELGIPGDAKEAMLFAILANETIAGEPISFGDKNKIPSVMMGKISFPE